MKLPNHDTMAPVAAADGKPTSAASMFFDSVQKWIRWAALNFVQGAPNLTTAGAIPKVSAAGALEESALKSNGNVVSMTGTRPTFLYDQGATARGRVFQAVTGHRLDLGTNVYYDGAAWQRDDATASSVLFGLTSPAANGGFLLRYAAAAAGAIAWTVVLNFDAVTGTMDIPGAYKVAGVQVVGAQMAAVAAPTGGGTAVSAPAGGAVIDVQARAAINAIIAAIAGAGNTVDPQARAAINGLRGVLSAALGGHGLTA